MVAGDCRGSHNLHILPVPLNWQTSYVVGADPLVRDALHQHQLGPHRRDLRPVRPRHAVGLRSARGAPSSAVQFRNAHGLRQPATLPEEDRSSTRTRGRSGAGGSTGRFEVKPPLVWNGNGKRPRPAAAKAPARS